MKITNGPFEGIEIPENELQIINNAQGEPQPFWPTHCRTPIFLSRFRPEDGWQVVVENVAGEFKLPDTRNIHPDGSVLIQPTQLFVAKLIKDGQVYAQASSLAIIDGPSAWERGETIARGRLYESMGLLGYLPWSWVPATAVIGSSPEGQDARSNIIPISVKPTSSKPVAATETASPPQVSAPVGADQVAPPPAAVEPAPTELSRSPEDGEAQVVAAVPVGDNGPGDQARAHQEKEASSSKGAGDTAGATISKAVNANLREQIQFLAKALGRPIPEIQTNQEAKAFYKELLAAQAAGGAA